jgi:type I restriction-modification system DNA methylase subunit
MMHCDQPSPLNLIASNATIPSKSIMATKQKRQHDTAVPPKNEFAETIQKIAHRYSLFTAFDNFLSMAIASCTQNPAIGKSWYEEEYLETIAKYKDSELRHEFPKAFASLINEMEFRTGSGLGNDVLGEFFEQHISNGRNGQFFTPYHICLFMASISFTEQKNNGDAEIERPLRILDPCCGSGRMLLASHRIQGPEHEYYGIDIDRTCVKMTALNLFLNGMWNSEVMCANALLPNDFVISYHISFLPLGIFKIEEKEKSKLWHMHKYSFEHQGKKQSGSEIILDNTPFSERKKDDSVQLDLF